MLTKFIAFPLFFILLFKTKCCFRCTVLEFWTYSQVAVSIHKTNSVQTILLVSP